MSRNKKTKQFLLLTFTLSYSIALTYHLLGLNSDNRIAFTIMGTLYMFIPALSVIIIKKIIYKEKLKAELFISFKLNKWFIIAWIIMPLMSLTTAGLSLIFLKDVSYSPDMLGMIKRFGTMLTPEQIEEFKKSIKNMPIHPFWIILIEGLIAGVTVNAIAAFGEELGWRGFLLNEFKELKFYKAAILIGFIWGIWHAPLILMGHNYPQHPKVGVFMMVILCVLLTFPFLYVSIKGKSVVVPSIMHGTMNATAGFSIMLVEGGTDLTVGLPGIVGIFALSVFISLLFLYDLYISKDKILTNKIINYLEK